MPGDDATAELPALVVEALGVSPNDVLVVLDAELSIVWVSDSARHVVGWEPDDLLGRHGLELLHPDELPRALAVATAATAGYAPRSTARYRIAAPDGAWVECDLSVGGLGTPEHPTGLSVWIRRAYDQLVLQEMVTGLLSDDDTASVLQALLSIVSARSDLSRCSVSFADEAGEVRTIGSELDPRLIGAAPLSDSDGDDPWMRARHDHLETMIDDPDQLPAAVGPVAEAAGLGPLWVVPLVDDRDRWIATVTTWVVRGGPSAMINGYAVSLLRQLIAVVVGWRQLVTDLADAARRDPLTGLANRRVLDEVLGPGVDPGATSITVLSLDLDRFKPINDELGHAAGDDVLRVIARRLEGEVRAEDVVLRVGGDEFVLACPDLAEPDALRLAERLRDVVAEPIAVAGTTVQVGTSVGVSTGPPGAPRLLEAADSALYAAKDHESGISLASDGAAGP